MNNTQAKQQPVRLVSCCKAGECPRQRDRKVREVQGHLAEKNIGYRQLVGSYNGVPEVSFVVPTLYNQESLLRLDPADLRPYRIGTLLYQSYYGAVESEKVIGEWREVTEKVARSKDSWSHDPATGQWWICE